MTASVGALVLLALTGAPAAFSEGNPDDPQETKNALRQDDNSSMSRTELLSMGRVLEVARELPSFSSEQMDESSKSLTIYLSGEGSDDLQDRIKQSPDSVTIQVKQSEFRFADLRQGAAAIFKANPAVYEVGFNPDGSGLSVATTTPESAAQAQRATENSLADETSSMITDWTVTATNPVEPADSRRSDTKPFSASAAIESSSSNCSAGIPVKQGSTRGILTAAHCGGAGVTWKSPNSDATVGKGISPGTTNWDARILTGQTYEGTMFHGGWTTSSKRDVARVTPSTIAVGAKVRVSGGQSGTGSLGLITNMSMVTYDGATRGPFYEVHSTDDGPLGGNGDSGSMVSRNWDGISEPAGLYVARSTATATIRPCDGSPTTSTRKCSTIGWVSPWKDIRAHLDLTLIYNAGIDFLGP